MTDEKLFELAVALTAAKIKSCAIPPSLPGMNEVIKDSVDDLFHDLRFLWENHLENTATHGLN